LGFPPRGAKLPSRYHGAHRVRLEALLRGQLQSARCKTISASVATYVDNQFRHSHGGAVEESPSSCWVSIRFGTRKRARVAKPNSKTRCPSCRPKQFICLPFRNRRPAARWLHAGTCAFTEICSVFRVRNVCTLHTLGITSGLQSCRGAPAPA
jgi:hypothetical protein